MEHKRKNDIPAIFPSSTDERFFRTGNLNNTAKTETRAEALRNAKNAQKNNKNFDKNRKPPMPKRSSNYEQTEGFRRSIMTPTRSQLMKQKARGGNHSTSFHDDSITLQDMSNMSQDISHTRPDVRTYTRLYSRNSSQVNGQIYPPKRRESTSEKGQAKIPKYDVKAKVDTNLTRTSLRKKSGSRPIW